MDQKARGPAEEAIQALGRLDAPLARSCVAEAYDLDHKLGPLADTVYLACAEIEDDGRVTTSTWNTLADAVGPGPLVAVVETSRSG